MKTPLLLLAAVIVAVPFALPPSCLPPARAQSQSGLPQTQIEAIDRWAGVIRRGQTSKVMVQVAELLQQIITQVEARKDEKNSNLVSALRSMHQAAQLRAQGLKKHDQKLLDDSESIIRVTVQMMHGLPWCENDSRLRRK